MTGWFSDFFRLWWALAYWNARKTWFRLNGAHRDSCPCQNFGDSGLALDSRCEAVAGWRRPKRFRKVCPLLVETKDGWRCGVDAERVRPFWGRAALLAGAALLAIYLVCAVSLFAVLRTTGYDLGLQTVVLPWHWGKLRNSQEQLHTRQARQALTAGNYQAAILSLQTVCQLNPRNHAAALTLASLLQLAGQASVADHIYERLMDDIPEQRTATAQAWYRVLLARADYPQITRLATAMLSEDSGHREAWLHALLFAARQTRDGQALGVLLAAEQGLPDWCVEVARIEQLVLLKHVDDALPRLNRTFPAKAGNYLPVYQVDTLLRLGRPEEAAELLNRYGNRLPADEATLLRLRAMQDRGWTSLAATETDTLLQYPISPRFGALLCALLVNPTDATLPARYVDRFMQAAPPLTQETLPLYQASYLVTEKHSAARAPALLEKINAFTRSDSKPLRGLAAALKSGAPAAHVNELLPLLPLPIEVVYAIQETPVKTTAR